MKRALGMVAAATLVVAVAAAPAAAQDAAGTRAMQLGVQGGISMPMGDFGDGADMGFIVAGTLGMRPAALPFGLRFDLGYQGWGGEGDVSFSSIHGMGSATFTIPTESGIRPYVLGGLGVYRMSVDLPAEFDEFDVEDSSTDLGIHFGGGIDIPLSGMSSYVEARYTNVFGDGDASFIPIVFGIRF